MREILNIYTIGSCKDGPYFVTTCSLHFVWTSNQVKFCWDEESPKPCGCLHHWLSTGRLTIRLRWCSPCPAYAAEPKRDEAPRALCSHFAAGSDSEVTDRCSRLQCFEACFHPMKASLMAVQRAAVVDVQGKRLKADGLWWKSSKGNRCHPAELRKECWPLWFLHVNLLPKSLPIHRWGAKEFSLDL